MDNRILTLFPEQTTLKWKIKWFICRNIHIKPNQKFNSF